jgi:hypothetical protein
MSLDLLPEGCGFHARPSSKANGPEDPASCFHAIAGQGLPISAMSEETASAFSRRCLWGSGAIVTRQISMKAPASCSIRMST